MAAKIKLQRRGAKNKPFYRVIVQDESGAPVSSVVEILGTYNPLVEPTIFDVDKEKTLTWIKNGAKPTDKVRILLGKAGILPPIDLASLPKRKSKKEEKAAAEAAGKESHLKKLSPKKPSLLKGKRNLKQSLKQKNQKKKRKKKNQQNNPPPLKLRRTSLKTCPPKLIKRRRMRRKGGRLKKRQTRRGRNEGTS